MIASAVRLTEIDPNTVRPGWVALLIVLALAVATFLLWRNMGKQMKKIDFDPDEVARENDPDTPADNGNGNGNGATPDRERP